MKFNNILPFFVLFFLVSSINFFGASDPATSKKVAVPQLNAEGQKKLEDYKQNNEYDNILISAIVDNNRDVFDFLLATQPRLVNKKSQYKLPIEYALDSKHIYFFIKLLQKTEQNDLGYLSIQAIQKHNLEALKRLIKAGANVKSEGLLYEATNQNNPNMMKWLLDNGADIHEKNRFAHNKTAICSVHSAEALQLLLNAKANLADLDAPDVTGRTWLDYQIHYLSTSPYLVDQRLIETVLKKLKNINQLQSINRLDNVSKNTPICRLIKNVILNTSAHEVTAQTKQKAHQIAQILLDYGAVCEDPELQTTLKEIKAERISPEIAANMRGSEKQLPHAIIGLIHEYTGAKLPTEERIQEETKSKTAQQQTTTSSTSALIPPSSSNPSSSSSSASSSAMSQENSDAESLDQPD